MQSTDNTYLKRTGEVSESRYLTRVSPALRSIQREPNMPGHYRQVEAEKGNAEVELQEFDKITERRG
jgi:hypothetical protein